LKSAAETGNAATRAAAFMKYDRFNLNRPSKAGAYRP
jgi:hypothetical protein